MKTNQVLLLVDKYQQATDNVADQEGIPACIREYVHDVLNGLKDYITEIETEVLTKTKEVV